MSLYGQNLADAVPDACTYQQGTDVCGMLEDALREALDAKDSGALVSLDSVMEGQNLAGLRGDLNTELAGVLALDTVIQGQGGEPETWSAKTMPSDYVDSLRSHVKTATMTLRTATEWFNLPSFDGTCDGIVQVLGKLSSLVASGASKILGNFLGGLWWVIALAGLAFLAFRQVKKGIL